ncbi:hypothetical protein FA13DRAFT_1691784 [Coprinellus micaceus]|uniref:Uncharacterized protein n=1 Tax=Coprinellus micaceus TaxID=71717 RepID=A0A4Y7SYN1_COPMI|nr:hypothetical protein FA13DRAFT_1691784 [Coprinellus micaceus]
MSFQYDCMMPPSQEFKRLTQHIEEKEPNNYHSNKEIKTAKSKFGKALTTQFTQSFGDELDSLDSWQALCRAVHMDPVPDTLEEAQIAFQRTHVNLVELTEVGFNSNLPITIFPTVKALSDYTLQNDLIFQRKFAKDGGFVVPPPS